MHRVVQHPRPVILIVDDETSIRTLLVRWLYDAGYDCLEAAGAAEAAVRLESQEVSLVTVDIKMPESSGLHLLDVINEKYPDTAVIMLTGERGTDVAVRALTGGACAYLVKPVDREELLFHVRRGLERRSLIIDKRNYTRQLERRVHEQTDELRRAYEETICRLVSACSCRDAETGGHVRRSGLLSEVLARAAGWQQQDAELLRLAAPMHDIGKIGIPDAILQKPGRLTVDEFEAMKQHTLFGAEILAGSESAVLQMAQTIAMYHHEKWNGHGYPVGLSGKEIPQAARIVAIVDVYDALTHPRVYRPALSEAEALSIMIDKSGSHFDPDLLELFLSLLPEMRRIAEAHRDAPQPKCLIKFSPLPKSFCAAGHVD